MMRLDALFLMLALILQGGGQGAPTETPDSSPEVRVRAKVDPEGWFEFSKQRTRPPGRGKPSCSFRACRDFPAEQPEEYGLELPWR